MNGTNANTLRDTTVGPSGFANLVPAKSATGLAIEIRREGLMRDPACHERECLPIRALRACAKLLSTDASSAAISSTDEQALHCVRVDQMCAWRDSLQ